jgi:hypothetical protein
MIKEHDIVALVRDLPERGLKSGQIGAVVMVHDSTGYEVEFVDSNRKTVAVVSVSADFVRPASADEQPQSPLFSIGDTMQRLMRQIRLKLFRQCE